MFSLRFESYVNRLAKVLGVALWSAVQMLSTSGSVRAAVKSWSAGDGAWQDAGNWTPGGAPANDDFIYIGNLPGVHDSTVELGPPGAVYGYLEISDGMTLDLAGGELMSFGEAWITGNNSRLIARPAPGPNMHDFQGELHVGAGAHLELLDNAPVRLFGDSESSGLISGRGTLQVTSTIPFRNDGIIRPSNNGGIVINQGQPVPDKSIDLDGDTGEGQIQLTTPFSVLEVHAGSLSDSFGGTISMVPGALLTMNVADGWTADSLSTINVAGTNYPAAASLIWGEEMTFAGQLNVGAAEGHLTVLAPATMQDLADVNIDETGWLEFDGETTVLGGSYTLGADAQLDFDGPVQVRGGQFTTASYKAADGTVNFNAATAWNGNVTINGVARQIGTATVTGNTVIDAGVLDMDGNGSTTWNVHNNLVINATGLNSATNSNFGGTLNIAGGFIGRLTVNLDAPSADWTMSGQMNLTGDNTLFVTRLGGAPVNVTGDLALTGGKTQITADTILAGSSTTTFATPATTLRMRGHTLIESGAAFNGEGILQNGLDGTMILDDGVSLGDVDLINSALLDIAIGPGIAGVDRFTATDDATWHVELGGYSAGVEHDLLLVSGGEALLDGLITVDLLDLGSGMFAPQIGDEFTVLTTLDGVSGTFDNSPISLAGDLAYEWSVLYGTHDVTLVLANITPEPAALVLLAAGGLTLLRRTRRFGRHS